MSRRRRPPSEVVLHSPVPFSDATDSSSVPDGVSDPREGVSPWSDSQPSPLPLRPLAVLPLRSVSPGVWGGTPQGKRWEVLAALRAEQRRRQKARLAPSFTKRNLDVTREEIRKRAERRRLLFNVLAVPFSRRARFCLIRKARREVIFARGFSGRNGARTYKRTANSQWRC